MTDVDLFGYEKGDQVRIVTESGEVLEGRITGVEKGSVDQYSKGYVTLTLEGVPWDQIADRVDVGVLNVSQDASIGSGRLHDATVWGWTDPKDPAGEYGDVTLGVVVSVGRLED